MRFPAIAKTRFRKTLPRSSAALADAADPVDGVLQQRRNRGIVFRADEGDAMLQADQPFQIDRLARRARLEFDVAVVQRQRMIRQRNPCHVDMDAASSRVIAAASRTLTEPALIELK